MNYKGNKKLTAKSYYKISFFIKFLIKQIGQVRYQNKYKIDLNKEYPCPCCKGLLQPITLTEALGCEKCQHIFIIDKNQEFIEQLSSVYPYKKAWKWTGKRWQIANKNIGNTYLPIASGIITLLLIIWLPLALNSSMGLGILIWAMVAVISAIIPAIIVWLSHRR